MAYLQGLMVIDKHLTKLHRVHYDMGYGYIGRKFRVEVHICVVIAAVASFIVCSRAHDGDFIPLHIGLRLNPVAMSRQ